ncbi:MAG: hypothetical protein NTW05_24140 [Pseudonocardiales bacterium]|nr:hypothetical protein [Pseudonocardiales bacterium]
MTASPVPLSTAVAPERERHRALVDAAVAWQAGRPRHTDPDLFALLCGAAEESGGGDGVSPTRWTRTGAAHLLRCDLPNWCAGRRCRWPDGEVDALWEWFDFLHATGRVDPSSDPLAELRKPLCCAGGLDEDGRPLPDGAPPRVECECFLPYRETALLLGELARDAVDRGEDVLAPLRRALGHRGFPSPWPDGPVTDPDDLDDLDDPSRWSGSGP